MSNIRITVKVILLKKMSRNKGEFELLDLVVSNDLDVYFTIHEIHDPYG